MRFQALLLICTCHQVIAESVINVIREYNSQGKETLTFILSKVTKYGKNKPCGFGEVHEKPGADEKSVVIERSRMLKVKSIDIGSDIVILKLFKLSSQSKFEVQFVDAQGKVIAKSENELTDYDSFFNSRSPQPSNIVLISSVHQADFCYEKKTVFSNPAALIIVNDDISDFHLSSTKDTLVISANPISEAGHKSLAAVEQSGRGDRPTLSTLTRQQASFRLGEASDLTTLGPSSPIDPLISAKSTEEIKNELKSEDAKNKLLIRRNDDIVSLQPKSSGVVTISFDIDGFNTGYLQTIDYNGGRTISTGLGVGLICQMKSITVATISKDFYKILIDCASQRRLNI